MYGQTTGSLDPIFYGLIVALSLGALIFASYRRKNRSPTLPNSPVLLAYYTEGASMESVKKGTFGDLHYSVMIASNFINDLGAPQSALLYRVELPFYTSVHLVGIPKKTGAVQLNPAHGQSTMERVVLEGDYNDYFNLFCEKGMQEFTRYVLDPKAMLFTVDFCQSQNWEIVANELYFVVASNMKDDPGDKSSLESDILNFVTEIRPAIEKPLDEQQKTAITPYNEDRRTDIKCPLCGSVMINQGNYFSCPKGDGVLLNGSQLHNVKKGLQSLPNRAQQLAQRKTNLTCPACGKEMTRVAYDGSSTMIDSCTNCPYRWLDSGEYKPLPNLM